MKLERRTALVTSVAGDYRSESVRRSAGAVGVVVGGGGAGEGGLEGGVVVQIQIHVVVEVEDAAAHVEAAVDVVLSREAMLKVA